MPLDSTPDPARLAWLKERRKGIGGSDIAAVLGLSPYTTPYDVWLDKTGQTELDDAQSEPAYWGSVLEDVVAREYQRRTGRKVQRVNRTLVHPELPIARCNVDRAVINPEIRGNVRWINGRLTTDRILECKTASGFLASLWGETGSDVVPAYYLTQSIWNSGIAKADWCDVPVLIGGNDYRQFSVAFEGDLMADMMAEADAFWKLVETREPPDPQRISDAQHRWAQHVEGKAEIVGVEEYRAVENLHQIRAEKKALEAREEAAKLTLMSAMGDAEAATHGGEVIATWKTQSTTRLDSKALKEDRPDLWDLYAKTDTSRVLRPRNLKETAQ